MLGGRYFAELTQELFDDLAFSKYQGLGNDFILVDNRDSAEVKLSSEASSRLCDRNFGIGGDGIIFAMPPSAGDKACAPLSPTVLDVRSKISRLLFISQRFHRLRLTATCRLCCGRLTGNKKRSSCSARRCRSRGSLLGTAIRD